jgi:Ca2+-binding EF-hand superfamily protein
VCRFTWLYGGALVYSLVGQISFSRGLYISVSVGYAIFWAEPHYTPLLKAYSILHVLFGSCMVACAMAAFARSIVESQKKWYLDSLLRQAMTDAARTDEIWDDIVAYVNYWYPKLKVPLLFVTWATLGIIWSCIYVEWTFIDGLYFVTSGLATGGMWPIPPDSPEWFFFFVGVYVSCGVPIMALAVGTVADIVANTRSENMLDEKMNARVTDEELQLMTDCGIENGDGFIDMAEFVILILMRLRAVSPELIGVIEDRFVVLDADKNGTLTHKELTVQRIEVIKRIQSNTSLRRILTTFD